MGDRPGHGTRIMACRQDEKPFREDMARARILCRIGRVVPQTPDRDQARRHSAIRYVRALSIIREVWDTMPMLSRDISRLLPRLRTTGPRPEDVGRPPGTPVYVGPDKTFPTRITHLAYSADSLTETEPAPGEAPDLPAEPADGQTHLVLCKGVHDADTVTRIAQWFDLHPLTVEDVLNTSSRSKAEALDDDSSFFVLKHVDFLDDGALFNEQVSLIWSGNTVLLFQEGEGDLFGPVLHRIRKGRTRIRSGGSDYLVIALLDCLMDRAFLTLSKLSELIETLENHLLARPTEANLMEVYRLKREVTFLLSALTPVQEVLTHLARESPQEVKEDSRIFLRDVTDHTLQVIEASRTLHVALGSMLDAHVSLAGLRMNRAMSVLTVVATIFIPLTFLAGIYGMNFRHMPELEWPWAYPALLGLMAALGIGLWVFFSRKKWF